MSTIGIAHQAPRLSSGVVFGSAPRQTRLRITARGRRVLLTLAAVPLAIGIGFAGIAGGSAIASGEHSAAVDFQTVTVLPGDTLWSIAGKVAPQADRRDVVDAIGRLNNLQGADLMVGQKIAIPSRYTD
ncbi:LysM peptidoglycan-binding domain-containing protein [Microbacterium sp.]|uniref:LysM peptidoglycan-binding domain-containing protein n=1 Tax=Microbacterium sp. TaxID=51671 RepID=UPI00333F9A2A